MFCEVEIITFVINVSLAIIMIFNNAKYIFVFLLDFSVVCLCVCSTFFPGLCVNLISCYFVVNASHIKSAFELLCEDKGVGVVGGRRLEGKEC